MTPVVHAVVGLLAWSAPWLAAAETEPAREALLILPIQARPPVAADLAEVVSQILAVEAARDTRYRVVTYREIEGALSQEQIKQVAGCNTVSCAIEIAGALNADQIVTGAITQVGDQYVFTLSRIRARSAEVVSRVAEQVPLTPQNAILERAPQIAALLFDLASPPAPAAPAPAAAPSPSANAAAPTPPGDTHAGRKDLGVAGPALRWVAVSAAAVTVVFLVGLVLSGGALAVGLVVSAVDALVVRMGGYSDRDHVLTQREAVGTWALVGLGLVGAAFSVLLGLTSLGVTVGAGVGSRVAE